jgi:ABC-type maltose transport system permease subunit
VMSLNHYLTLPWELIFTAVWNTAILAVLTPAVVLAISLAFSWIVLRSRIRGRAGFDFIAFLPHAIPSIVFGVGALLLTLFVLQRALPLYGTIWILLIVFVIARISYGTRMTNSGLIQIHTELEESAQMSGASSWQGFRRISLPLLAPTLLCLALDRAVGVPRTHARGHSLLRRQRHIPGRGLEPLAWRRPRSGFGLGHRDARHDDALDRALLGDRAKTGAGRDLIVMC